MKIKVEKSIKLGLPNYSSVAFSAGIEEETDVVEMSLTFKKAWEIVEEEINKKSEPYHGHLGADKAADTDPAWIREQVKKEKGSEK